MPNETFPAYAVPVPVLLSRISEVHPAGEDRGRFPVFGVWDRSAIVDYCVRSGIFTADVYLALTFIPENRAKVKKGYFSRKIAVIDRSSGTLANLAFFDKERRVYRNHNFSAPDGEVFRDSIYATVPYLEVFEALS